MDYWSPRYCGITSRATRHQPSPDTELQIGNLIVINSFPSFWSLKGEFGNKEKGHFQGTPVSLSHSFQLTLDGLLPISGSLSITYVLLWFTKSMKELKLVLCYRWFCGTSEFCFWHKSSEGGNEINFKRELSWILEHCIFQWSHFLPGLLHIFNDECITRQVVGVHRSRLKVIDDRKIPTRLLLPSPLLGTY